MLVHPQFDPIAFSLGPLSVRWYGLMYLVAFVLFVVLGRLHARRRPELGWDAQGIDDLLMYGVIGVIVGGRLGEVLFFQPGYYLQHPGEILAVWKGGMSFHGGFLGVLVAMWLYGRRHGKGFWQVTDFIAPLVPTGLAKNHKQQIEPPVPTQTFCLQYHTICHVFVWLPRLDLGTREVDR